MSGPVDRRLIIELPELQCLHLENEYVREARLP